MPLTRDAIDAALATVNDPEIRRPITELGMVQDVQIGEAGHVTVDVLLTVAGCPMKDTITRDVTAAVSEVEGVTGVTVNLGAMTEEQREAMLTKLRGGVPAKEVPFARPDSLTRVYCITSGKGGVGKSSVTVNLAAGLAARGLRVGVVDADMYGFSVPRMLGCDQLPTKIDDMLLPPVAHDVKVISLGMFAPAGEPVMWRGPMLHRATQQFLTDVFWGDLDVLLLDLPPGTGDIAMSVANLLPSSEIIVVTTPQGAAAEVAERSGALSEHTHQRVAGVIENMSWLEQPDGTRLQLFGAGGGQAVADSLGKRLGTTVELLGQVPIDMDLREGGDEGSPVVLAHPESPAGAALNAICDKLAATGRGLAGRKLPINPS